MRHDKTKTSLHVKLIPLPRDNPRCEGLAPNFVIVGCNTCDYFATIKNDNHCIAQANMTARNAHKPTQTSLVPQQEANMQTTGLVNQLGNQRLVTTDDALPTDDASIRSSLDNRLSSGLAPMSIDQSQTNITQAARTERTQTQQHGFTMNVSEGRMRMADGTVVEGNFQMDNKGSTVETEIAEYKQQITHLQTQCKTIEAARVKAVEDAHEERSDKNFFKSCTGHPILAAIADNKSGMELMFSGLVNKILLEAINELVDPDDFDEYCEALPDFDLDHPFVKRALIEDHGMDAYVKLRDMKNQSLERKMPRLVSVGVTPQLLRKMKLLPTLQKKKPKPVVLQETRGEQYNWGGFKTDFPPGELPSLHSLLRRWHNMSEEHISMYAKQLFNLHLSREDGERPKLLEIMSDDRTEYRTLEENDFKITKMYTAYDCVWEQPNGVRKIQCPVPRALVRKWPEYQAKIKQFEDEQL